MLNLFNLLQNSWNKLAKVDADDSTEFLIYSQFTFYF